MKPALVLSRAHRLVGVTVTVAALAGCDLSVSNPGPIEDTQLNTPTAVPAIVNGMSGDLSFALGNYVDRGALASFELMEAGNFIAEGEYSRGTLTPPDVNVDWANMQTARWTSETGLDRLKTTLGAGFETNANTPRAYLYAGFANRMLGENTCVAVIDGAAPASDTVYFVRAESLFTRANLLATALSNAAVATVAPGSDMYHFVVTAQGLGSCTITIADTTGNSVRIPTTVNQ